jgi:hypothetical protein
MSRLLLAVVAGGVLVLPQTAGFPASAVLTEALIEAASRDGEAGAVTPYRFSREIGRPPGPKVAVYTPYVRVALAGRHARQQGREFDHTALPGWVTEPSVLVVFGAPCAEAPPCRHGDFEFTTGMPVSHAGIAPGVSPSPRPPRAASSDPYVQPLAITTDLSLLDELGGVPFPHAQVAATFPASAFQPGLTVFASWGHVFQVLVSSGARITADDLRDWR